MAEGLLSLAILPHLQSTQHKNHQEVDTYVSECMYICIFMSVYNSYG
jgi:hypothetical protein